MPTTSDITRRSTRRTPLIAAALTVLALAAAAAVLLAGGDSQRGQFGWLRPSAAPVRWPQAHTPSGALLVYPPSWHSIHSDAGAVSAALTGGRGKIAAYLNATPRSGGEAIGNWARFRPAHNADEGERAVRLEGSATGLRFRSGHGACVIDSYTTSAARYREIACIVAGSKTTTVVVGAAPVTAWHSEGPALERAIAAFTT